MDKTSFHGNKIYVSITAALALALCLAVGTYRLKKTAQLKLLQKKLAAYSFTLEQENQLAKSDYSTEVR